MLGTQCSPCCLGCQADQLPSFLPEINVRVRTNGFAVGIPGALSQDIFICALKQSGEVKQKMYSRSGEGVFSEIDAKYTLVPGEVPPFATPAPGYVTPRGYVFRAPMEFGVRTSTTINPQVALLFYCGTQTEWNVAGNFLWAVARVCLPIYEFQDTYTTHTADESTDLTATSGPNYGTHEFNNTAQSLWDPTPEDSGWHLANLAADSDAPCQQWPPNSPSYCQLVVYEGQRPSPAVLPFQPAGQASGLTHYIETGDLIATHRVYSVIYNNVITYKTFAYFQTPPAIVGEYRQSDGYVLYEDSTIVGDTHARADSTTSYLQNWAAGEYVRSPIHSRLPLFVRGFIESGSKPGIRTIRKLGWTIDFHSRCGSATVAQPDTILQTPVTIPGTEVSELLWQGPTVSVTIERP